MTAPSTPSAPTPSTSSLPPGEPPALCPVAPGKGETLGLSCPPGAGWVLGVQGAGRESQLLVLPSSPCAHCSLPTARPAHCSAQSCPWPPPAHALVMPWVTPHAGTPLPRGWALAAALGELFSSKTLISSFRPCPFSPFLFLCLSLPLLLPPSHLCHSDCRVKLWNYVPGLTPCLPRRVLAIKGRATSLP